jgi:hypothetical protein
VSSPKFAVVESVKNQPALRAAVRAVVEHLEGRQLLAADPFANEATIQTLPYVNDFNGSATTGLHDKDGEHVGLTRVQVNKNGRAASYVEANLDQVGGALKITTTGNLSAGSNYNGDNTLTNGVETMFDATTGAFQITARLIGPISYIAEPSEQAGISFGPDQDNYVKVVAVGRPEGTRLQFTDEQLSGTTYNHVLDQNINIGAFSTITSLDLRLIANASTGVVSAYYSVNGGAFIKFSSELTLSGTRKSQFFSATAKAGLVAAHKNNNGAITATFDRFAIEPITVAARPSVRSVDPSNGSTGVLRNAFVGAQVQLPAGGIDSNTLNSNTVRLYRTSDRAVVPANVGTSGGGDVITLTPTVLLDRNTSYTFEVTDGVKDVVGNAFVAFSSNFTTGTAGGEIDPSFSFEKIALSTAVGEQFTALKVGPDGRLYAGTNDGRIFRYGINANGTLGAPTIITTLHVRPRQHRVEPDPVGEPRAVPLRHQAGLHGRFGKVRRRVDRQADQARVGQRRRDRDGPRQGRRRRDRPAAQRARPPEQPAGLRSRQRALLCPGRDELRWRAGRVMGPARRAPAQRRHPAARPDEGARGHHA